MGRRRNSEPAVLDDLLEWFQILPIWAGPTVAFVVFAALYWFLPWIWAPNAHTTDVAKPLYGSIATVSPVIAPIAAGLVLMVWLIAELSKWANRVKAAQSPPPPPAKTPPPLPKPAGKPDSINPACPDCGATMVLRTARKGTNAGSQFWGCSTYPACRSTLQVATTP